MSAAFDIDRTEVDLTDPAEFVAGVPHGTFDRHRHEAPIQWIEPGPASRTIAIGSGFWSVTNYAAVREGLQLARTLSSNRGGIRMEDRSQATLDLERRMLLLFDPPEHRDLRLVVNHQFLPRVMAKLESDIRRIADEAIDRIASEGSCDFVDEISAEVPLIVIADLLGVERRDRTTFRDWSDTIANSEDPDYAITVDDAGDAIKELASYGEKIFKRRLAEPGDDLMTAIAHGERRGVRLDTAELVQFWILLLVAGNETTRNALSGALLAFSEAPEQWELLRAEPERVDAAAEEILRWVSPVHYLRRTATADIELNDTAIASGQKVVLWLTAANRDPEIYDDPHRFDITRDASQHLALGYGSHFCLGAHLARLEMRVVLHALLERLPDIHVSGPPVRIRNNFFNGVKRLPIEYSPLPV